VVQISECPIADFSHFSAPWNIYQELYNCTMSVQNSSLNTKELRQLFDAHTKSRLIRHGKVVHVLEHVLDKATVMHEEMVTTRVHLEN